MKTLRSKITTKFAALLILGLGTIISAGVGPEEKEAPLNPFFFYYQKFLNEGIRERYWIPLDIYHFGEVPSPVDRSHVKNVVNPYTRDWYPTSYDLRTMNKLTAIRNQGACGSCWTFATMASLESFGKSDYDWNFSEQDLNVSNGFDFGECNGGNHDMATAYLARWSGPLAETDVPYPYGDGSPASEIIREGYSPQKHVQQVIFIPQRSDFLDNDTIKYFISTYGAVYISFYYSSSYIDTADLSFYNNVNTNSNHAVAAVGWDDDYSAGNFRPDRQPPGDGAFLIRNSWGTNRHDNGYFWISYYDTSFKPRASLCNAESPDNYNSIYQYDPLGHISNSGYGGTTAWGANIFTAVGDSFFKAVSFHTNDANTNYEIYIYKGVTPGSPTSGSLEATKTGSQVYPGYYTEVLNSPVSISTDDVFSVVIRFINSSYTYPIAIEKVINGYSSGAESNPGESFMSSSGTSWTDVYSYGWNVCIKAFTVNSYTISGTVTSGGSGLENVLMSGLPGNALTSGSGFYTDRVERGWSGTVTPTLEGYSFVDPSTTYTNVTSNQITDYTAEELSITVTSPNGGESWIVGSTQDITWTTTGTIGNVKIAYSTNNGSNWIEIVASTENDGTHPWTVPDAASSQCLIRVSKSDGSPSDTSNNVFSIVSAPGITVTSPNGYENWQAGSAHNITWTSTGTVGNVKIEYSTNNGGNWTEIIASTENDGSFPWTLPEVDSNQCLICVSETDGSPTDTSDNVFTIFPPSITVTSPNGGENWQVNSQHTITWTSVGTVGNVQIEYSTNNGDNWTEITPSTGNDGSFPWTIPGTVSDQCLIRVSETDGTPSDTSDVVFSIRPISTITVISPNGGENWDVSSVYEITWTSEGIVGNVMIEYSTNGGTSWRTIVESTENDGSYNWNVPAKPSDNSLVRISETDEDGSPSDISDAVFSIVSPISGSITLRSPNGGETWLASSTQQIKWNSTGDINYVNIKYSKDNGTTWKTIAKNAVNNHNYNWVVPKTASDKCLVRVAANDSDLDPKPWDVSDAVFSIILPPSPTIRITAPNGGEQLVVGSRFTITWDAANTREDVRIEYSINGGQNWREITGAVENNGKYDWNMPDDPSDNCLVRVSEIGGQPSDVSDALFSIVSPSPGDITVISPNGGETWNAGSSQEITWTAAGIDDVTIEYSRDYGTTWKTIVQTTPNNGSFNWTVPDIASDECLVRISSNDEFSDPKPSDISDAVFSIVPPSSLAIKVITPNGGEQLVVGSMFNITWGAIKSRDDVKIDYSVNGGQDWIIITNAADNNGDFEWLVPDTPSETCLVRISEIDGQPLDISDAVFSIVQPIPGEITVTAPNGGESWTAGSLQEIKWTAGGINNVTIEYSTDYGTTWEVIVQTTANDGSFDWTIPDKMSDECLVRISSNDADPDPVPSDISDEVFSIVSLPAAFSVTSPNGGESWEVGSTQSITWTNSGDISDVMIEYSSDNGNTWNTIVSSVSNSGTYDWQVPATVSEECLVRVSANDGDIDPKPSDVSDSVFSIVLPSSPTIRVITPNGGEELIIGSIYEITWFGTDSRAQVKIEYSINGGENWTEIIDSTENDGDYDWTVPDEPSEACLVRISEIDGQPVDVSDAVFSIVQPQTGDLTVLTPNGGENLETGSEYNISWTCSGLNNVIIEYSVNNGVTWLYIDKVPADNGNYTWTVPGTPSDSCLVSVTGADSDENPSDVSDEVFTIFDPTQASIEVFTPNGGENLSVGEEYYITWASTGVNNVLIEYSIDNGDEWIPIDTVSAIGGRFTWTIPDTLSDSCLIRISGDDSPEDPSDVSNAVFSIIF